MQNHLHSSHSLVAGIAHVYTTSVDICPWTYLRAEPFNHSLLVFCLMAGPWLPVSPQISILCLSLHYLIRLFHQFLRHSYSLPSSASFPYHMAGLWLSVFPVFYSVPFSSLR